MWSAKSPRRFCRARATRASTLSAFAVWVWLHPSDLPLCCQGPELTAALLCEGGSCALKYARSFSLEVPEQSGCVMSSLDVVRPTKKEICALLHHLRSWTFLSSAPHSTETVLSR